MLDKRKVFNHYTKFDNNFNANIMKSEGFVLMGVDKCIKKKDKEQCLQITLTNDKYFWPAILQYTSLTYFELFDKIRNYLQENQEEFISLNQNKIYSQFKTRVQRKQKISRRSRHWGVGGGEVTRGAKNYDVKKKKKTISPITSPKLWIAHPVHVSSSLWVLLFVCLFFFF